MTAPKTPEITEVAFYTVTEVVEMTRLSLSTVRRLIASRRLASHQIGRVVRISADDLHAFLVKRRTGHVDA